VDMTKNGTPFCSVTQDMIHYQMTYFFDFARVLVLV